MNLFNRILRSNDKKKLNEIEKELFNKRKIRDELRKIGMYSGQKVLSLDLAGMYGEHEKEIFNRERPCLILMDEAHVFTTASPVGGDAEFYSVAREGRSYNMIIFQVRESLTQKSSGAGQTDAVEVIFSTMQNFIMYRVNAKTAKDFIERIGQKRVTKIRKDFSSSSDEISKISDNFRGSDRINLSFRTEEKDENLLTTYDITVLQKFQAQFLGLAGSELKGPFVVYPFRYYLIRQNKFISWFIEELNSYKKKRPFL